MNASRNPLSLATRTSVVLIAILLTLAMAQALSGAEGSAFVPTRTTNDANTRKGFDNFYNMDYDKSIREFEAALQAHPDDPFAVNHLLSAVVFKELLRIGALDTEAYSSDNFLDKKNLYPLDPKVSERVNQLSAHSIELSDGWLAKNPNDVNALYARGVARGLKSTYMGMAQHAWFAGLRNALGARHDHERVLELDPNYVDAKNLLGIHLYVIGSLSWPAKVAASMVGIGVLGGVDAGIGSELCRCQEFTGHPPICDWEPELAGQGRGFDGRHRRQQAEGIRVPARCDCAWRSRGGVGRKARPVAVSAPGAALQRSSPVGRDDVPDISTQFSDCHGVRAPAERRRARTAGDCRL